MTRGREINKDAVQKVVLANSAQAVMATNGNQDRVSDQPGVIRSSANHDINLANRDARAYMEYCWQNYLVDEANRIARRDGIIAPEPEEN